MCSAKVGLRYCRFWICQAHATTCSRCRVCKLKKKKSSVCVLPGISIPGVCPYPLVGCFSCRNAVKGRVPFAHVDNTSVELPLGWLKSSTETETLFVTIVIHILVVCSLLLFTSFCSFFSTLHLTYLLQLKPPSHRAVSRHIHPLFSFAVL